MEIKKKPKFGGRKKGTPNRASRWLRDQLEANDIDWPTEYKKALAAGNTAMMSCLTDLLPYLSAKLNPADYDLDSTPEAEESADILSIIKGNA